MVGNTADAIGPALRKFTVAPTLVYHGCDLTLFATRKRPRAAARVAALVKRCDLVRKLPVSSRPECTADAIASLWLPGCTILTKTQTGKVVYSIAKALRGPAGNGPRDGRVRLRSRLAEHLIYAPGLHRSCA